MPLFDDYSAAIDESPVGPIERQAIDRIKSEKTPGIVGGAGAAFTNQERDAIEAEKAAHQLARQRAGESDYSRKIREQNEAHNARLADGHAAFQARQQAIADAREAVRQAEIDKAVAWTMQQGEREDEDVILAAFRAAQRRKPGML